MAEKRTALVYAALKRFYKPAELTEVLGLDAAEIRRYAFLARALYQVARIDLVDGPKLYHVVNQFREMIEDQEGVFFEAYTAAEKLGVREDTILQMLAGSQAVYQIGPQVLINVKEAEAYIRQFRIYVAAKEIWEAEKRQAKGSRFVRELKQ